MSAAKKYVDQMKEDLAQFYVRREAIEKERDEEMENFTQRLAYVHERIRHLEVVLAIIASVGVIQCLT